MARQSGGDYPAVVEACLQVGVYPDEPDLFDEPDRPVYRLDPGVDGFHEDVRYG